MTNIVIEKNVPMPRRSGSGRGGVWPFNSMDVGDSIPLVNAQRVAARAAVTYFHRKNKGTGKRFSVLKTDPADFVPYRIFRVS